MLTFETSVRVYHARFYLVSHPQPGHDDPHLMWGPEEDLAVSAGDGIGLNSITSEHMAHVTLEVFSNAAEVPAELQGSQPRYWFTSSSAEIAVIDNEGTAALVVSAPAAGRITCVVTCSGREAAYNARHYEQRNNIRDVERWRITLWPDSP